MRKILIGIALLTSFSFAVDLNKKQIENLNTIRDIAKQMPNKQGKTFEDTISAISLVESAAGTEDMNFNVEDKRVNLNDSSVGVLQVKVSTARELSDRQEKYKYLKSKTDKEIATMLLKDIKFNTEFAIDYFIYNYDRFKDDNYFKAISLYNGGIHNYKYVGKILNSLKIIEQAKKEGLLN